MARIAHSTACSTKHGPATIQGISISSVTGQTTGSAPRNPGATSSKSEGDIQIIFCVFKERGIRNFLSRNTTNIMQTAVIICKWSDIIPISNIIRSSGNFVFPDTIVHTPNNVEITIFINAQRGIEVVIINGRIGFNNRVGSLATRIFFDNSNGLRQIHVTEINIALGIRGDRGGKNTRTILRVGGNRELQSGRTSFTGSIASPSYNTTTTIST